MNDFQPCAAEGASMRQTSCRTFRKNTACASGSPFRRLYRLLHCNGRASLQSLPSDFGCRQALYGYLRYNRNMTSRALQRAIRLHLFGMASDIAPDDVSPFGFEIPGAISTRSLSLIHILRFILPPDSAGPYLAIGAFYNDIIAANELDHPTQKLAFFGQDHFF